MFIQLFSSVCATIFSRSDFPYLHSFKTPAAVNAACINAVNAACINAVNATCINAVNATCILSVLYLYAYVLTLSDGVGYFYILSY